MSSLLKKVSLSNGLEILCFSKNEARFGYQEVQDYLKYDIQLKTGDTVFDVGANIGLFTIFINHSLRQDVSIYAFEPIPQIFKVLEKNISCNCSGKSKIFNLALGQAEHEVEFTFYPNASMLSGVNARIFDNQSGNFKRRVLEGGRGKLPPFLSWMKWFPDFLWPYILDKVLARASKSETVKCQMTTLSKIIQNHSVEKIDLLKVDVEGSELQVLLGIEDLDWTKIKQIFIEVDDWSLVGEKIMALLKEHGFHRIYRDQKEWMEGSQMFNLYATRS